MPELPEVEIAREGLEAWLVRRRILGASVPDARIRGYQRRGRVEAALTGATVRSVSRRGKFLLFDLGARRPQLLAHLGMTGRFVRVARNDPTPRYARAELRLSRGERILFLNARRLGQFRLVGEQERRRLDALGIEPLSAELTTGRLFELSRRSRRPIKLFLMDQHKLAGIGNIQAAEALFLAGIHPGRPADSLERDETARLARAVRRALRSEIRRYRRTKRYIQEGAENHFHVYGHSGEPCPRCRKAIAKLAQGGRTTYFCPRCQPYEGGGLGVGRLTLARA